MSIWKDGEVNKEETISVPKRVGYLYEKMCDKELIQHCIYQSAKRKHHRFDVKKVLDNIDKYVDKTYDMLVNETYYPATPKISSRYDHVSQKTRDIYIIPFWPDGVIQMLMVTVRSKIWKTTMSPYN